MNKNIKENTVRVFQSGATTWSVRRGTNRACINTNRKEEAIKFGQVISLRSGGELIVE